MKAPPPPASEGAPEWMVSFADLVTIMMAFFVVMYAMAPRRDSDEPDSDLQRLMQSVNYRFGPDWRPFDLGGNPPRTRAEKPGKKGVNPASVPPPAAALENPQRPKSQRPRIQIPGRGDRLAIGGIVYFSETSAELSSEQLWRLQTIGIEMIGKPQKIQILAHTTKRPAPIGADYQDNWDLAYARGRAVMQKLVEMGIDAKQIRVALAAGNEPVHLGGDPTEIKKNSRVEIYFLDIFTDELEGTAEERAKRYAPNAAPDQKPPTGSSEPAS